MEELNITVMGCGWLGFPLAEQLKKKGFRVSGSTRSEHKLIELEKSGINSFPHNLILNPQISTEITAITDVLIITIPPLRRDNKKFYGSKLREMVEQFTNANQIIFLSSTGIYPKKEGNFDESYSFTEEEKNNVLYCAEEMLKSSVSEKLTILRLGGLIGPNRHPVYSMAGKSDVQNPESPVNIVHQGDVISFILRLLETKKFSGIYNLVFPDYPSKRKYYTEAANLYGLPPISFSESGSFRRTISSEKAMNKLGFRFLHDIRHKDN